MSSESVGSSNPLLALNNSQKQQLNDDLRNSPVHRNMERDICYNCKKQGHWTVNCPDFLKKLPSPAAAAAAAAATGRHSNGIIMDDDESIPDRKCPCGAGSCFIRTSRTEKNPGRKFYACPAKLDMKCNFFQWCDMASYDQLSDVPETPYPMCPCGAGICSRFITKKEGKNKDRPFFTCPVKKGEGSCQFFQWQDTTPTKTLSSGHLEENKYSPRLIFNRQEETERTTNDVKNTNSNKLEGVVSPVSREEGSKSPLIRECQVKEEMVKLDSMVCDDIISPIRNLMPSEDKVTLPVANQCFSESSYPMCHCGAGPCSRFTEESGENKGQSFFVCPIKKGEGACNFFQRDDTLANNQEDMKHGDSEKLERPVSTASKEERSGSPLTNHIKEEMVRLDSDSMVYNDTVFPIRNLIPNEEISTTVPVGKAENGDSEKLESPVSPVSKEERPGSSLTREYHIKEEIDSMVYNDTVSPIGNLIPNEDISTTIPVSKAGQCLWCGREGHWLKECITSNPLCFRCGKFGHWMKYCTG